MYYNMEELNEVKDKKFSVTIKPRMGGTQYYLEKKRKQDELVKLTAIILGECGTTRSNIFNTLCWLEQKGMLNGKSVTAYLKYKEDIQC